MQQKNIFGCPIGIVFLSMQNILKLKCREEPETMKLCSNVCNTKSVLFFWTPKLLFKLSTFCVKKSMMLYIKFLGNY